MPRAPAAAGYAHGHGARHFIESNYCRLFAYLVDVTWPRADFAAVVSASFTGEEPEGSVPRCGELPVRPGGYERVEGAYRSAKANGASLWQRQCTRARLATLISRRPLAVASTAACDTGARHPNERLALGHTAHIQRLCDPTQRGSPPRVGAGDKVNYAPREQPNTVHRCAVGDTSSYGDGVRQLSPPPRQRRMDACVTGCCTA